MPNAMRAREIKMTNPESLSEYIDILVTSLGPKDKFDNLHWLGSHKDCDGTISTKTITCSGYTSIHCKSCNLRFEVPISVENTIEALEVFFQKTIEGKLELQKLVDSLPGKINDIPFKIG